MNKIKEVEDDISTISIKVKELEGANKILEKEEFQAKEATDFMKNVISFYNLNMKTIYLFAI